ncbi:MAG: nucleotidyltransferase domain-containing protein [Peptococcaceae bacterium]|nr:nucleotidyltransferase domain-containing protein [Peptococcaceae bacterium]
MGKTEKFFGSFPEVIAVYLFGSHVTGNPTPLSDVDIGVLLDKGTEYDSIGLEMRILGGLQKIFKRENVDLTVLNRSPLPLQFNITGGKLLYDGNSQKRIAFEEYVRKYYLDCLPIYREYREEFFKRIREGRMLDG